MNKYIYALNKINGNTVYPKNANKCDKYICPECKADLILRQGDIRTHHFAHKSYETKCNYYNRESQTHMDAKELLKNILESHAELTIRRQCCSCKSSMDYIIPTMTDTSKIVLEYSFKLNGITRRADLAYLDNNEVVCLFEICYKSKTEECNRPTDIEWFEFQAEDLIKNAEQSTKDAIVLHCIRNTECVDCNNKLEPSLSLLKEAERPGIIYFNQRGAGCGKTYESIQLVVNDMRFTNKSTFIYLTKVHSAKDVIRNEFIEQLERGLLNNLDIIEQDFTGRQYKITCVNKQTEQEKQLIIGTIDSFTSAVVDKNEKITDGDKFRGIVKQIQGGKVDLKHGIVRYAQKDHKLSNNTLIIIDEAQDLNSIYLDAFCTIINKTNIDLYIIGDKLQSIWSEHNIYTYVERSQLTTEIIRSDGINKVMRFHNNQLKDMVNKIINFKKYNLPQIEDICTNKCCKYKHEDDIIPYTIFETQPIYASDIDYNQLDREIKKIITYMEKEIEQYNYLPHNFLFIFPFLKSNVLAKQLEIILEQFWIDKFKDKNYQQNVLAKHPYWSSRIDDNDFYSYVYLHKSEEGQPIDLKVSEYSTRIMTIHASKGNGCEVVFLLGCSEGALKVFSKDTGNLVYDSLLHVAITRQKKAIYIGIQDNNDDICKRLKPLGMKSDEDIKPNIYHIKSASSETRLVDMCIDNEDIFKTIDEGIIQDEDANLEQYLSDNNNSTKPLIEWGHHTLRYHVSLYNMKMCIINNEKCVKDVFGKKQFVTILRKLAEKDIIYKCYKEYVKFLTNEMKETEKKRMKLEKYETTIIPILRFDYTDSTPYYKYSEILYNTIENIQAKIKQSLAQYQIPVLCPLECIVLEYMKQITSNHLRSDLTIMEVYSIMYCYDMCSNCIDNKHILVNKCTCNKYFKNANQNVNSIAYTDVRNSITNHYENVEIIKSIYNGYKNYISEHYSDSNTEAYTYNIDHRVYFKTQLDPNFTINTEIPIIGYNNERIIYIIFTAQFSSMNFNKVIIDMLFKTLFINDCSDKDDDRYKNKQISACIISLDKTTPIFIDLDITKYTNILLGCISNYLYKRYSEFNSDIYKYFNYCRKINKSIQSGQNSFEYTYNKLKAVESNNSIKKPVYGFLPEYYKMFFNDASVIYKNNKQYGLNIVNDESFFNNELNDKLKMNINKYLNIQCETDNSSNTDNDI